MGGCGQKALSPLLASWGARSGPRQALHRATRGGWISLQLWRLHGRVPGPLDDWSTPQGHGFLRTCRLLLSPGPTGKSGEVPHRPDATRSPPPDGVSGASQGRRSKGRIQGNEQTCLGFAVPRGAPFPAFSGTPAHPALSGQRPAASPAPHVAGGSYLRVLSVEKQPPDPRRVPDITKLLEGTFKGQPASAAGRRRDARAQTSVGAATARPGAHVRRSRTNRKG